MSHVSLTVGELVAIRSRVPDGHLVGRVEDAHQSIFLIRRHVRGTPRFQDTDVEIWAGHIIDVARPTGTDDVSLSEAMECLWRIADSWRQGVTPAVQPPPSPLGWRLTRDDLPKPQ
jgi:hypothetical protein